MSFVYLDAPNQSTALNEAMEQPRPLSSSMKIRSPPSPATPGNAPPSILRQRTSLHHKANHLRIDAIETNSIPSPVVSPHRGSARFTNSLQASNTSNIKSVSTPTGQQFDKLLSNTRPKTSPVPIRRPSKSAQNLIEYTSGTSGNNKPFVIPARNNPLVELESLTLTAVKNRQQQMTPHYVISAAQTLPSNAVSLAIDLKEAADTPPHYPCNDPNEVDKRKRIYKALEDAIEGYQNQNVIVQSSRQKNSATTTTDTVQQREKYLSYAHPEDLLQVSCYLFQEVQKLNHQVDQLQTVIADQDAKIAAFTEQAENDFDLIKVRPKMQDLDALQKSITRLEEEIISYDPILFKEIQIKEQTEREEEAFMNASPFRIVSLPYTAPSPTLKTALPLVLGRPSSSMLPSRNPDNAKWPSSTASSPTQKSSKVSFTPVDELKDQDVSPGEVVEELPSEPTVKETTTDAIDKEVEVIDEKSVQLYVDSIRRKFKLLDDFVFVLKKKIQRLEQTDQDLNSLVSTFGSVEGLLEENEKMKREIHFLGWVQKRFDSDMLLHHEYLYSDDIHLLRAVIFALQNELL
jgi:flagellar biosynthesis chaperone FliJ